MRRAAAILLLALALTGCTRGSSATQGFEGEEKRVAQVIADLSGNAAQGKHAETCDQLLSKALRERVAGGAECASELKKAFQDADQSALDVKDVTIEGMAAGAQVTSEDRGKTIARPFKLVEEDQRWRIDGFG